MKEHFRSANRKKVLHRPLYHAINKYGVEHFSIRQLAEIHDQIANEAEQDWIEYYNSFNCGYNATLGGDGKTLIDYKKVLTFYNNGQDSKNEIAKKVWVLNRQRR